jgi:oligosaccharyltransferase complex subunit alpha (ribophorin I)
MRAIGGLISCIALSQAHSLDRNVTSSSSSKYILPSNFRPLEVFKNVNLVRNINLEKSFTRETINAVIENISKEPQDEYFLPFEAQTMARIGGLEVRDMNYANKGPYQVDMTAYDLERYDGFSQRQSAGISNGI